MRFDALRSCISLFLFLLPPSVCRLSGQTVLIGLLRRLIVSPFRACFRRLHCLPSRSSKSFMRTHIYFFVSRETFPHYHPDLLPLQDRSCPVHLGPRRGASRLNNGLKLSACPTPVFFLYPRLRTFYTISILCVEITFLFPRYVGKMWNAASLPPSPFSSSREVPFFPPLLGGILPAC